MEPPRASGVVPCDCDLERSIRFDVGIFSLPGSERSTRRHQLPLAALRNLQPAARRGGAVCRHHGHHQNGPREICVGHRVAARLARNRDAHRWISENLCARSRARFSLSREIADRCVGERTASRRSGERGGSDTNGCERSAGRWRCRVLYCVRDRRTVGLDARMVDDSVWPEGQSHYRDFLRDGCIRGRRAVT